METMKKSNGETILTGDATNPETWNMYSFEVLPNVHDMEPLNKEKKIKHLIVAFASLAIYFALCLAIAI